MNIILAGYGKMGKAVEEIALERGHTILFHADNEGFPQTPEAALKNADMVIEFTEPASAFKNLSFCLEKGIKVVSGTTGWLNQKPDLDALCLSKNGHLFHASNFSIGMNLFFHLNKTLAKIMNEYSEYDVEISEIHHTEKKDAPSGTALVLAQQIIDNLNRKTSAALDGENQDPSILKIAAHRQPNIPGTHSVYYNSVADLIEIKHIAHNRKGFALGAVLAAEWLAIQKPGSYGMSNMLGF